MPIKKDVPATPASPKPAKTPASSATPAAKPAQDPHTPIAHPVDKAPPSSSYKTGNATPPKMAFMK